MVGLALGLLPPLLGGLLYLIQRLTGAAFDEGLSVYAAAHAVLVVAAIASAVIAATRRRRNRALSSAWLYLLAGIALFSAGELVELLVRVGETWYEELLRIVAFLPLGVFAWRVASPLTLVFTSRRRLAAMGVAAALVFVVVAAAELLPLLSLEGPADDVVEISYLFALARPFLDALLFAPLGVVLAMAGLRSRGHAYAYVSLGFFAALPADILLHYEMNGGGPQLEGVAFLLTAVSLMYFVTGCLWYAFEREPGAEPGV